MVLKLDTKQTNVCKVKSPSTSPTSACVLTAQFSAWSTERIFLALRPNILRKLPWLSLATVLAADPSRPPQVYLPQDSSWAWHSCKFDAFSQAGLSGSTRPSGLFWVLKRNRALSSHSYWALRGDHCLLVLAFFSSIPSHLRLHCFNFITTPIAHDSMIFLKRIIIFQVI